jgi:hypothetical protein
MSAAAEQPIYEEGDRVRLIELVPQGDRFVELKASRADLCGTIIRAFELNGDHNYFVLWDNGMGATCTGAILRREETHES